MISGEGVVEDCISWLGGTNSGSILNISVIRSSAPNARCISPPSSDKAPTDAATRNA